MLAILPRVKKPTMTGGLCISLLWLCCEVTSRALGPKARRPTKDRRQDTPGRGSVGLLEPSHSIYAVVPYSRSLFTPGIGTGYLPLAFGMTGAGPLVVKSATPGAISW